MSNIKEARALLNDDNLVWSEDFERIRKPLSSLLDGNLHALNDIADAIVEADITAPDPLEQWVWDAARQLKIYDDLTQRSVAMAGALKKLFGRL